MVEDTLDETIRELQEKIEYDEEKTYSKAVIREYRNPTYYGVLKQPDAVGIFKGPCGDTMKIFIKVKGETIINARFWTDGCGATLATGNMLLRMIEGKSLKDAEKITDTQLIEILEGLPKNHRHCALLAIRTLHDAIRKYQNR